MFSFLSGIHGFPYTIVKIITLSRFTAEPMTLGSWFHSHFDNVMTQFIIIKKTDA